MPYKPKGILMKISKNNVSLPETLGDYAANMSSEDSGELRVLVYVLAQEDGIESALVSERLGIDESEVISAISFWRGMGILKTGSRVSGKAAEKAHNTKKTAELPNSVRDTDTKTYTGEEIAEIMKKKPELSSLLDYAQTKLERIFSPSDVAKLVYLEDYILMTPPMIMRVIEYCCEMDKKSMRYVEKTALSIYDEGIQTYAALEDYFLRKKAAKNNEGVVRGIMGIGERNFTSAEKAHISKWFDEYQVNPELITLAYEKTIASISKPSIPYMSKLLMRWSENGYKTAADVDAGKLATGNRKDIDLSAFDEAIPTKKQVNPDNVAGLDLDDFFENN